MGSAMAQIGHFEPSSGPQALNVVPIATRWLAWVGLTVTIPFDLVSGFSQAAQGPKRPHFCPKGPILVAPISV